MFTINILLPICWLLIVESCHPTTLWSGARWTLDGWEWENWVSVVIDVAIGHYHHHCHDKPSSRPVGTSASMAQHFSLPSCGKQYVTSDCRLEHDHQAHHHHHVLLVHPTRSPGPLYMHTEPVVLDKSLEPIAQSLERGGKLSLLEN